MIKVSSGCPGEVLGSSSSSSVACQLLGQRDLDVVALGARTRHGLSLVHQLEHRSPQLAQRRTQAERLPRSERALKCQRILGMTWETFFVALREETRVAVLYIFDTAITLILSSQAIFSLSILVGSSRSGCMPAPWRMDTPAGKRHQD